MGRGSGIVWRCDANRNRNGWGERGRGCRAKQDDDDDEKKTPLENIRNNRNSALYVIVIVNALFFQLVKSARTFPVVRQAR